MNKKGLINNVLCKICWIISPSTYTSNAFCNLTLIIGIFCIGVVPLMHVGDTFDCAL